MIRPIEKRVSMFIESTPELASLVLFVFRDRLTRRLGRIHNQQEQEQEKNKGIEADEAEKENSKQCARNRDVVCQV